MFLLCFLGGNRIFAAIFVVVFVVELDLFLKINTYSKIFTVKKITKQKYQTKQIRAVA